MTVYRILVVSLCIIGLSAPAFADRQTLRRYNEAQSLDLKIRQKQSMSQQRYSTPSDQQRLNKEFQRQRFRQQSLQQRQLRETSPAGSPLRAPAGRNQQLEKAQKAQQLDFKIREQQQAPQNPPFDFHMEGSQ